MLSTMVGLGLAAGLLVPAHPLGNFTVNQYSGLRVGPDAVVVDYVLDMAELPAFQTRGEEIDRDDADGSRWAGRTCAGVAAATALSVGGRPVPVTVASSTVTYPPGQGGLATLRLECRLQAPVALGGETLISYRAGSYLDRLGWREVTAVGDGVRLVASDVPATSPSARLTSYPSDALSTPPNVVSASLRVAAGGSSGSSGVVPAVPTSPTGARGFDRLTVAFTDLVGRPELTFGIGLLGLLLAIVLGAAHAFAPGHGKTVLAAYLVAERGSLRHALAVAGTVTLTHTAGVLVLGLVLTTSLRFAPERLYGWLGAVSGLLLAGVGAAMLRRAFRGRARSHEGHSHSHSHGGHSHSHGGHSHSPGGHTHAHGPEPLRLRGLLTLGFAGGLAPSPSAVVVLLGAVALGRTWFGALLVLGYGLGMAVALGVLGVVLAKWRRVFERRSRGRLAGRLRRAVPVLAAGLVLVVGLGLTAGSLLGI